MSDYDKAILLALLMILAAIPSIPLMMYVYQSGKDQKKRKKNLEARKQELNKNCRDK